MGSIKEFYEQQRAAEEEAAWCYFNRLVANGKVADTDEAWRGFAHGWDGIANYKRAQRDLQSVGQGSYMLGIILIIYGVVFLGLYALMAYLGTLASPSYWLLTSAVVGLVIAACLIRHSFERSKKATEAFNEIWAKQPETKKEVIG